MDEKNVKIKVTPEIDLSYYEKQINEIEQKNKILEKNITETSAKLQDKLKQFQKKGVQADQAASQLKYDDDSRELFRLKEEKAANDKFLKSMQSAQSSKGYSTVRANTETYSKVLSLQEREKNGNALTTEDRKILSDFGSSVSLIKNAIDSFTAAQKQTERNITTRAVQGSLENYNGNRARKDDIINGKIPVKKSTFVPVDKNAIDTKGLVTYKQALSLPSESKEYKAARKVLDLISSPENVRDSRVFTQNKKNEMFWGELFKDRMVYDASQPKNKSKATIRQTPYGTFAPEGKDPITGSYLVDGRYLMPSPSLKIVDHKLDILGQIGYGRTQENTSLQYDGSGGTSLFNLEQIYEDLEKRQLSLNKKDPQYKEQLQAIEQVKNSIIQSVLDAINNYERSDNLTSLGNILKGKFTAVEAGEKRTSTKFKDTSSLANMVRYKLRGNQPSDFETTGFFNAKDMLTREGEGSTQVDRYDRKKQDEEFRRQDDSEREKIAAQERETSEALENLNKVLGLSADGVETWLQTLLSTSGAESVTQAANEILSQASDVLRGVKADSDGNVSLESSFSSLGYDSTGNSGRSGLITSFNYNELEDEANRNDVEQETLLEKEKDRIAQMEDSFQTEEELLNEAQKSLKTYNDFLEAVETQIREMQNNLDPSKIEERAILGQYADQLLSRRTNTKNPFNKTLEQNQQEGANRFARFIMQSSAYDKSWQSYADDTGLSFEQVKERALNAMPDGKRESFEIDYEDSKKAAQVFFDTLQGDWQNLEKAINTTFGTITSSKGELAEVYSQFKSIASGKDLKQGFLDLVQNQLDPTSRRSLNRYAPDERVSIKYPVTDNSLTAANIKEQDILFGKGVNILAPYGVTGRRVDDREVGDATFKEVTSTFDQAIEVIDRRLEEIDNAEQKYQETSEKVAQSIETISDIEKKYGVKETKSGKKITWSEGEYSKEEISSDKYRYQKAKKDIDKFPIAPKPLESERERLLRDKQALQEASFSTKLAYANVEPKNDINIPKVTNQEQKKQDIQETNKELEQQKQLETEIKAIEEQQTNQQEKEPLYDLSILQKRYDDLKAKPDDNDLIPQGENINITPVLREEDAAIDEVNNSFSKHIELVQQATQVEQEKQNASAQLTAQLQEELQALQKLNEEFDVHNGNVVRTKGDGMFTFGDFIPFESTQNLNSQDYEDYELREKAREQRTHAATNQTELIRISGDKGFSGGKSPEQLIRDTKEWSSLSAYPQDWRGAVRQYQKEVDNIVKATLAINKNMEEQKILEEQIKEIKASGVDENNSLLLKLEQELAKRKQNLAIAKEQYEAAQIARDETGVADMANATNSRSFTEEFARQVKQIDANAEISLREQLASSDTKAETLGIVTNFKREQADIKQADVYLKRYIQNLKQQATIEADIRRTDVKASSLTGREAFEAQQVRAALEKQRKLVESQTPVYENGSLNGVKLTQEQINKLNEEKAKIEAKSAVTQARITRTYSSQVGILKTISNTFKNSFAQLVGMNVIANKLANSVSQVFTNAIANTKALNKNMVDLQIASGASYSDIKNMMLDFNKLAKKVGKSTQEVAVAANDWLRAGYEGEDAAKLVESSMQLSVLGMIESSQATEYLISVMKGWKLEVSEVSSVVDKLSAVDMAAAVSAGDLATAMQRSSVSAQIAGSTLDRYIGMLTVVAETTQKSPETVGESFKTLYARFGKIAAGKFETSQEELEAEGLAVEDMTNLNEIEQVLNSVGIQLRDSIDSFRNVDDVLDEVAENWETYSDVQKSGIATAIARTRQRENFLVLMENWNQVAKYEQISANSYGTAIEKMEAYTSGVEAAQKRLTASMEKLALWFNNFGALEAIYNTAATLVDNMAIFAAALLASAIALDKGMAFTLLGNGVGKLTSILGNVGAMFSGIGNLGADKNYFKNLLGLNFTEGSATSLSVVREMYSSALGRATVALTADEKAIYDNIQSTLLSTSADTRKTLASHMLTNSLTENDISLLENTQLEQLLTATTGETVDARKARLAAEADYTQALRREATNLLNNSGKAQGTMQVMRKNLDDSTTRTGASLAASGVGNIFGMLAGGWSGGAIGNLIGGASGQTIGMMLNGIIGGKAGGNLIGGLTSLKGYRNKKNNITVEANRIFDTTYEDVFAQKQQELREYASLLIGDTGAFIDEDSIISQAQDAASNAAEQAAKTFTQSSKQNLKGSILGAFGGPIGLASIGLQIGMAVWSAYLKAQDEALKKAQDNFKKANDKYTQALNTSVKADKYDKLAQGVDYLGRNISLTDDEYQEFLQISNELAEAFPELIVRTDSFGNKLVGPNGLQGQVGAVTEKVNDLVSALKQDVDVSIFEKAFGYFIQFGDFKFGKVQGKSVFEQQKEDIKSQIDGARKERFNDATDEGIQSWIDEQFKLYQGYENQVNNLSRQGYGDEDKIYQNAVKKRNQAKQDYDDLIEKQKEYQSAIKAGQAELNGYIPSIIAYATTAQGALDGLGEFAGLQNRLSELNTDEKSFVDAITQLSTVHIAIDDNYEENVLDIIDKITKIVEDNPIVADLYYGVDDINILDFDKYSIKAKETVKKIVSQIKDENVKQDIIKAIGFSGGVGGVIGDLANPLKEIQDNYSNKIADYDKFIELVNNGQYSVKDIQIIYELLSDSVEDVAYNVGTLNDILFDTKYKNSSIANLAEEWDRLNKLQEQGEISSNQEATMEAIAEILTVVAKALGWENEELDKLIPKLKMVQGIRPDGETTQTTQEMEDQIKTYENYYKYMRDDYKGTWDTENLTAMSSDAKVKDKLAQFVSGEIGQSTFTEFLKELSDASKQQYKFKIALDLADTESGYQALLKGNSEVIDKMQKQYGIDARNFTTFSALKEFVNNGVFKGILTNTGDWVTEMAKKYDEDAGNFTRRQAIKAAAEYLGKQDNVDYQALWEQSGKQTSLKRFTEQYHDNLVREKVQKDYNTMLEFLTPLTTKSVTAIGSTKATGNDAAKKAEEIAEAYESSLVKEFSQMKVSANIGISPNADIDEYQKQMNTEYFKEMKKALENEASIYAAKANTSTAEGLQYLQKWKETQVKINNLDDEEVQDKIDILLAKKATVRLTEAETEELKSQQKLLNTKSDTEQEYYEYLKKEVETLKDIYDEQYNLLELQSASVDALIAQQEKYIKELGTLERADETSKLEAQKKLNELYEERRELAREVADYEKYIAEYNLNKLSGTAYSNKKAYDAQIKIIKDAIVTQEKSLQDSINAKVKQLTKTYMETEGLSYVKALEKAGKNSDVIALMKEYWELTLEYGEIIMTSLNDKVDELKREIDKMGDERPKEWTSVKQIQDSFAAERTALQNQINLYTEALKDLSKLTDDQIIEITDGLNEATIALHEAKIQEKEDIKTLQEKQYGAVTAQIGLYKDEIQNAIDDIEDAYDKEYKKIRQNNEERERAIKLEDLLQAKKNAAQEKERVYREGKINALYKEDYIG